MSPNYFGKDNVILTLWGDGGGGGGGGGQVHDVFRCITTLDINDIMGRGGGGGGRGGGGTMTISFPK